MNHNYRSKGFTVVEVLISFTLTSIVTLLLLSLLSNFLVKQRKATNVEDVQAALFTTLNDFIQEIRFADDVKIVGHKLDLTQYGETQDTFITYQIKNGNQLAKDKDIKQKDGTPINSRPMILNNANLIYTKLDFDDVSVGTGDSLPLLKITLGMETVKGDAHISAERSTLVSVRKKNY